MSLVLDCKALAVVAAAQAAYSQFAAIPQPLPAAAWPLDHSEPREAVFQTCEHVQLPLAVLVPLMLLL